METLLRLSRTEIDSLTQLVDRFENTVEKLAKGQPGTEGDVDKEVVVDLKLCLFDFRRVLKRIADAEDDPYNLFVDQLCQVFLPIDNDGDADFPKIARKLKPNRPLFKDLVRVFGANRVVAVRERGDDDLAFTVELLLRKKNVETISSNRKE